MSVDAARPPPAPNLVLAIAPLGSHHPIMAIRIPRQRIETRFSRSSGPGGQHVNKTATKAEIRFVVADADWIPAPVRRRLSEQESGRISKDGTLIVTSEKTRSQSDNLEDCFQKLAAMLARASVRPKTRKKTRPTRASKERRLEGKRQRASAKKQRSWRPD